MQLIATPGTPLAISVESRSRRTTTTGRSAACTATSSSEIDARERIVSLDEHFAVLAVRRASVGFRS
jgi:hypothetical protein